MHVGAQSQLLPLRSVVFDPCGTLLTYLTMLPPSKFNGLDQCVRVIVTSRSLRSLRAVLLSIEL
jgi:hypothetical protein